MNAKRMAQVVVGLVMMLAGIALGVYVGLWWALIGGIVQVIEAAKASPVETMQLAWGVAKIVFAGFLGIITAVVAVLPGFVMVNGR